MNGTLDFGLLGGLQLSLGGGQGPLGGLGASNFSLYRPEGLSLSLDGDRSMPTRSQDTAGNSKGSSAYASRHQAAEQRRRMRINERLDLLRKIVPHTKRANTASFLEDVINYVTSLKARVDELEAALEAKRRGAQVAAAEPAHLDLKAPVQNADSATAPAAGATEAAPRAEAPAGPGDKSVTESAED